MQVVDVFSLRRIGNFYRYHINLFVVKFAFHQQTAKQVAYSDISRKTVNTVVNQIKRHPVG